MSCEEQRGHSQNQENPQEDFIRPNEVEEEITADETNNGEPMDEDENEGEAPDDDVDESIQIDMSNNSVTYFDKHTDSVFTVFQHPLLPLVCSGGGDNIAHLWTVHSQPPKFAGSLDGHTESVIAGGFTSDGKFLVTGDMTGKVIVSKSHKGGSVWKKSAELQEVDEITWLKCHPTIPGIFAFGATDGSVWCYQIEEQSGAAEQLMSGFAHQEDCTTGEFVNINQGENVLQLVTAATDGSIIGWNGFTGEQLFKISKEDLKGFEVPWITLSRAPESANSALIGCGSNNGVFAVINANKGAVLNVFPVMELEPGQDDIVASIESIAWSSRLSLVALGLVSGDVLIYDVTNWRLRHKINLEDSITKILIDNEENMFVSCINGKVYEFDIRSAEEKFVCVGHNMGVLDFVLCKRQDSPTRLVTAGDEGVSLVFEVPT